MENSFLHTQDLHSWTSVQNRTSHSSGRRSCKNNVPTQIISTLEAAAAVLHELEDESTQPDPVDEVAGTGSEPTVLIHDTDQREEEEERQREEEKKHKQRQPEEEHQREEKQEAATYQALHVQHLVQHVQHLVQQQTNLTHQP